MPRHYLFADEAGNLDFTRKQGATKYFILTSVQFTNCRIADQLKQLHRELVWDGLVSKPEFHATEDRQDVRNRVYDIISGLDIRIDATIFEKSKTVPHRQEKLRFLELVWYQHIGKVSGSIPSDEELHVIAASWGTNSQQAHVVSEIRDALDQHGFGGGRFQVSSWLSATDPCLQVADYRCWAIQRRWERGDDRSHVLIKHLIRSEYEMWSRGTTHYY